MVSTYLKTKNIHAVQYQYQLRASIRPLKPLPAAHADEAGREVPQFDREAPLKVRACRGTWEGSSVEGLTLGYVLCRSYSKVEESALTATPKFEGGPARDL